MRRKHRVRDQSQDLRLATLTISTQPGGNSHVAVAAVVAVYLRVELAAMPAKPVTNLAVGLATFDPDTDPLAHGQRQGCHDGHLHWSGLCVNSGWAS